jgi:methylated-DNA-[protein]-cysteine S-methyltransferase
MTTHPGYCALIDTAFGTCGLAWNERGVTRLLLPQSNRAAVEAKLAAAPRCEPEDAPAHIARLTADIRRYFAGEEIDFSAVTVELSAASDFERGIYRATGGFGFGRPPTSG